MSNGDSVPSLVGGRIVVGRRFVLWALVAVVAATYGSISRAALQEPLPDARDVINRHIEAIGGEDAVRALTSRHATGSFEVVGQGMRGTIEISAAAPDRLLVILDYEGVGEVRQGYDGEVGWTIDPMMGPRLLAGGELDQMRDEADFYSDLHDPSKFESIETLEQTEFDGRTAYKLKLVRLSGREFFEYYDTETGLMIGNEGPQESPMGTVQVVSTIGDYQEFDGVLLPTGATQELSVGQMVSTVIETVEHGTVPDSSFDLPEAIQALRQ